MPGAWEWWAGTHGDVEYEGTYTAGAFPSRVAAIAAALADLPPGDDELVEVIEARSSTAAKYEGAERVPFTQSRNRETLSRREAQLIVSGERD